MSTRRVYSQSAHLSTKTRESSGELVVSLPDDAGSAAGDARESWGRIINLTSVAAQAGSLLAVHYSAAKAGVIAATKSYARMLAKEGVTVNAISPALIATEMVASNPHVKPDIIPVGRFGRVEECGDVAVLLAGNAYITGQTIGVNGGLYLGS